MYGKFGHILSKGCLFATGILICLSYQARQPQQLPDNILSLYKKADRLFQLANPTPHTDSTAIALFTQVISTLEKEKQVHDTLLLLSWVKKGNLLDTYSQYADAKNAYLQAVRIKTYNPAWSDSLLYEVYVYTGSAYYHLNNFDSASYYLLQAENLSLRFPHVAEKARVFNALGALYYENGNYQQSHNYFSRALDIIKSQHPEDHISAANFENNIAISCYRLGLYDQCLSMYQKLLSYNLDRSTTYLNMGKAFAALGNYRQSLACFRQVNAREAPGVFNDMAHTQLLLGYTDSAALYLNRLETFAAAHKFSVNSVDAGINRLYRADVQTQQGQYEAALHTLQQAIILFSGRFNNPDVFTNPGNFTGAFASYFLFQAIYQKAATLEKLYHVQHQEKWLQAALATYQTAISLLRYIEKSYDTDDAKLFLKNNSQQVYQQAFGVCLALHALHLNEHYLEQAFIMGERNKASVMYAGVREKAFQKLPGIDPALIQQERNIKYNLARLQIKSDQTHDSLALQNIAREKAGFEISLAQVQKQIEKNSSYYKLKYSESYPGIAEIQAHLSMQQALISFYVVAGRLHIFVVTASSFRYTAIDSFAALHQTVAGWVTALQTTENGRKFKGEKYGAALYRQLVKPVQALAGNKEEWIIIPDNILYFLPFESLPANEGLQPLLETNTISYQFAPGFLVNEQTGNDNLPRSYSVLAFAPFAQTGMPFPHATYPFMDRLAASEQEIDGLPGKYFTGNQATKEQFLANINQYPVVHLATHAIADTGNSSASFIAFYPCTKKPADDALYLEELYSLNMDATRLVIISACETGHGQLVNSEGVLSLTRGFAYAGCGSMVNSLWKADDDATSAILQRFHVYLEKGYTKSKALQQAKIDYLHSNALHKTPNYWAHLILMGNTQPVVRSHSPYLVWILLAGALVITGIVVSVRKTGRKKKVDVVS